MAGTPTRKVDAKVTPELLERARRAAPAEVTTPSALVRYALARLAGITDPAEWVPQPSGPAKGQGGRPRKSRPAIECPDTPEGIAS